jgi:hypothetical protein
MIKQQLNQHTVFPKDFQNSVPLLTTSLAGDHFQLMVQDRGEPTPSRTATLAARTWSWTADSNQPSSPLVISTLKTCGTGCS